MSTELAAGLVGLGVFVVVVVLVHNRLVRLRFDARSSWSDIDVHLRKRYDLVPNLVETVRGYAAHERETLTRVTERRALAIRASTPGEKSRTEHELVEVLRSLFALAESYPALEADAHFRDLMTQLREMEDNIEYARRYYNAAVRDYNVAGAVFPSSIVAAAFTFLPMEFFELGGPGEAQPVTFSLS